MRKSRAGHLLCLIVRCNCLYFNSHDIEFVVLVEWLCNG